MPVDIYALYTRVVNAWLDVVVRICLKIGFVKSRIIKTNMRISAIYANSDTFTEALYGI